MKVAIGIRPLGFLDRCSTSCHVTCPSREDRSLHVFSTEYKSPSLRPVNQEETMWRQPTTVHPYQYSSTICIALNMSYQWRWQWVLPGPSGVPASLCTASRVCPGCTPPTGSETEASPGGSPSTTMERGHYNHCFLQQDDNHVQAPG